MTPGGTGLGDGLSRLVGKLDTSGRGILQVRVEEAWRAVAGSSAVSHTSGAHLRGSGELLVQVDSSVWATELSALSELYRTAVNEHLGQELVRAVRFTVSTGKTVVGAGAERRADNAAEPDQKATPRAPLSPEERRQVEASVAVIKDEGLRETVLRATVADLEWKKGAALVKSREKGREAPQTAFPPVER